MAKYDINNPKMSDSVSVDLALNGFLENRIPKKFTFGMIYDCLKKGQTVSIDSVYENKFIERLYERFNDRYPSIIIKSTVFDDISYMTIYEGGEN